MAISDYDRQAFAQALRSLSNSSGAAIYENAKYFNDDQLDYFAIFGIAVVAAMDDSVGLMGNGDVSGYLAALADIVERPTCRNMSMKTADVLLCSECGEHVDIAHMEICDEYHARFCPNCGAEVVPDGC